jgi:hypothetical protein
MRREDGSLVMGHYSNVSRGLRKLNAGDVHKARQVLAELKIIT